MADATFTTVVARVDQQLTNAIWEDQIRDNVNQLAGSHRNQFVNGGLEFWQRGAGPFTAVNFTADQWRVEKSDGTATGTTTQETTTIDSYSVSSLKMVATVLTRVVQKTEHYLALRGQDLSVSVRVRQGVASNVRAYVQDSSGYTYGSAVATTGSFVTLMATRTVGASVTEIRAGIEIAAADTVYLDNAMLVIGPDAAPYRPLHPQEDLARCQRYYEVMGGTNATFPRAGGYVGAGALLVTATLGYVVRKGGIPTVTKNGTWFVSNCGQPTVTYVNEQGFALGAVSSAAGMVDFSPNTSDDTVTIEWNP